MTKPTPLPPQSPFVYEAGDYQDHVIRITVTYDNATRALTGATVFRDAACVYTHIYIGVGADGTPNTSPHQFVVPAGITSITTGQLSAAGLTSANQVYTLQITAGL